MNDIVLKIASQNAARPKFRGHKKLKSKVVPHYPANIEREYMRLMNIYTNRFEKIIKKHLPKILSLSLNIMRVDGTQDELNYEFAAIASEVTEWTNGVDTRFSLEMQLQKLAEMTKKMSVEQWKKICERTLGINILEDYYKGEFYREAIKEWVNTNINLIKTTQNQALNKMQEIITDGWQQGRLIRDIEKDIKKHYTLVRTKMVNGIEQEIDITKRHARMIARDQIGKLNAEITRSQQKDAGVSEYIWSSVQDERVRDRHAELNGKRYKWGEPPIVDERTGRRAEPGEDYQCRCVALPVFDIDELNLVFQSTDDSRTGQKVSKSSRSGSKWTGGGRTPAEIGKAAAKIPRHNITTAEIEIK